MRTDQEKGRIELEVFGRFAACVDLPLDAENAEKRSPPEPDILCRHEVEGPIAFEIVEICDFRVAQTSAEVKKSGEEYRVFRTNDPTPSIIRKKLKKEYSTDYPIELVCHLDGRAITPSDVAAEAIRIIVASERGPFRRVWLLSYEQEIDSVSLIWQAS